MSGKDPAFAVLNGAEAESLDALVDAIRACRICVARPLRAPLPHAPNPVLRISSGARLLVAGQAPGARVNLSGAPFDDRSGDRLREWMGVDRAVFYDESRIAIAAMGFCFPGYDAAGGDLPPRRECRLTWHDALFARMPAVETVLAIGRHAQDYHFKRLGLPVFGGVSETVAAWRECSSATPRVFPLPHPSWRNTGWLRRHPWFETELLPDLRREVARLLG
jgi:uracil-DNA glycosylase